MVYLYTGRDAAHKLMIENAIKGGKDLPFDVKDQGIYYGVHTPSKTRSQIIVQQDQLQVIEWMT